MSTEIRQVEKEIDESIKALPLWRRARERVVRASLDYYRSASEVVMLGIARAALLQRPELFESAFLLENRIKAGVFYVLKWALTLCPEQSVEPVVDETMIHSVQQLGAIYETWVDALKFAQRGLAEIAVDREAGVITVYEGGEITGEDWALVEHQWRNNPGRAHVSLTEDADQLTTAWTAGDYRRTARWLRDVGDKAMLAAETIVFAPPGAEPIPLFSRPMVVKVPAPPDPAMKTVLDHLTLTPEKLVDQSFWRYATWTDTPLILAGQEPLCPSDLLVATGGMARDDHMLRLASIVDNAQYVRVSGRREERMIGVCCRILEPLGWTATPRFKLSNPPPRS